MPQDQLARALYLQSRQSEKRKAVHFAQQASAKNKTAKLHNHNLAVSLLKQNTPISIIHNTTTTTTTPINEPSVPSNQPSLTQDRRKRKASAERNPELREYRKQCLGINSELSATQRIGESALNVINGTQDRVHKTYIPPTPTQLRTRGFGQISIKHSFNQEASFETTLLCIVKSGFLTEEDKELLGTVHPLIAHLIKVIQKLSKLDFSSLRNYNTDWATQKAIPQDRVKKLLACLLHYDGRVADVMRYLGGNYTAEYRNVKERMKRLEGLVDRELLDRYEQLMSTGAPSKFVAETTRQNAELYRTRGNHPSIVEKADQVQVTMNKEERNCFVIPFPMWIARYLPNIFYTPQHILEKPGKKDRQVFDGSRRFTPTAIPVNKMTSTAEPGVELDCKFGDTFVKILQRIWNLRISYPDTDIILHANDIKSCFRQVKHHPDVAGAFSYIIGEHLFAQCGLTFGSDFSPAIWEPFRRMAEQIAHKLFDDNTLVAKHWQYLSQLQWGKQLQKRAQLVPAHRCSINKGVLDETGHPNNTPHFFFVDDGIMAEIMHRTRILRAEAASIETAFLLLGESCLQYRQDPVSWDKLLEMVINYHNIILGYHVNTRRMTVAIPHSYLSQLNELLQHWHDGRKSFTIPQIEPLIGKLGHAAETVPWLKHLMGHLYTSLSSALSSTKKHLIHSSKAFRNLLRMIKQEPTTEEEALISSFAVSESARRVHREKTQFFLLPTAKAELRIIRKALADPTINKWTPIAHMIKKEPDSECAGDSCLYACGGWSVDMGYWFYHEWSAEVQQQTLRHIKNNKQGDLLAINPLEYATGLLQYAASYHYWVILDNITKRNIPYPTVRSLIDNTSAISWLNKGCKKSKAGRALGRLQCALLMNSPLGLDPEYINTKKNVIADDFSRIMKESNLINELPKLFQKYPSLKTCKRFLPNPELISYIEDAALSKQLIDPLTIRDLIQKNPGKIAGSNTVNERSSEIPGY